MRPLATTLTALVAALALAACSQEKSADAAYDAATDAAPAEAAADSSARIDQAGPGISGSVTPGVAFIFNYAFTLPAKAIAGVQQEHAAACAQLGPKRCRVTGMTYEQPGEDQVEAQLDFLLAPDLAHRFGSEGIALVEKAEGKLENAQVGGTDAGGAIRISQQDSAAIQAEVERLETRLKAKGLAKQERADLQARLSELHDQLRGEAKFRGEKEDALATTPVSFAYSSEGLMGGNVFGKAAGASLDSAGTALTFLMLVAGIALPWLALIALGLFGWRWIKRRTANASEPAATQ